MPTVKLPNGKLMDCTLDHFHNVISKQHRGSVLVDETPQEVGAEAPIPEVAPKAAPKAKRTYTRKKKVTTNGN